MSSPVNGVNSCNYTSVYYSPSGVPISSDFHDHSVPSIQQWDCSSPPPSYDSLDRLPTGNEEASNSNTPPAKQIWIKRTENNISSTSAVTNVPPSVQQVPSPQSNTPSMSPEQSGLLDLSHPISFAVVPQTIDITQQFRKYKPKVVGIVLVSISILEIILGISLGLSMYSNQMKSYSYGTLFWVPLFHTFTGAMLIASWARTSHGSIQCAFFLSFLSLVASVAGLALNSCDIHGLDGTSGHHLFVCGMFYDGPTSNFGTGNHPHVYSQNWPNWDFGTRHNTRFTSKDWHTWDFGNHKPSSSTGTVVNTLYCIIALNVMALLLSLYVLFTGNAIGINKRSQHPYILAEMPR